MRRESETAAALAYQGLQPGDILQVLERLGFRCDGSILALNSYENRVYRIGVEGSGPIVAKFYRPARWTDAAIAEEHVFAAELADSEIPVVAPLAFKGSTLHRSGPFRLAVYPCRGGRAPDLDDFELLRQLGRLVARIHCVGETRPFQHRPKIDAESYGIASKTYLVEHEFIPDDLKPAYISVADQALTDVQAILASATGVRHLRLHADFHPGNVLIDGEQLYIVDLDDARTGPAVQDLWMFLSGDQQEQTPQLDALLQGYEQFRSFDVRELYLIEPLRTLRIMHYAAWIARRWRDPAFRSAFPWFDSHRYWEEHVLMLREQIALMQEPPLTWSA